MSSELQLPGTAQQRHHLLHYRETQGLPWPDWRDENFGDEAPDSGFGDWRAAKRHFTVGEIADRRWVKTCTQGYITELFFRADGTVIEHTLFDRVEVSGDWRLSDDGTLEIVLRSQGSHYQIEAVASESGAIHSAIEFQDGVVHAYLKLMQLAE